MNPSALFKKAGYKSGFYIQLQGTILISGKNLIFLLIISMNWNMRTKYSFYEVVKSCRYRHAGKPDNVPFNDAEYSVTGIVPVNIPTSAAFITKPGIAAGPLPLPDASHPLYLEAGLKFLFAILFLHTVYGLIIGWLNPKWINLEST